MLIINTGDKNTIAIQISMIIINIGLKAHKWIVAIEPSTIPRLDDTYATTTPLTRLLQLALAIAIAGHTRAKEDITPLRCKLNIPSIIAQVIRRPLAYEIT